MAPESVAAPESLFEVALVETSVAPGILAEPLGHSVDVFALVEVAIAEYLAAHSVLEPIFESAAV